MIEVKEINFTKLEGSWRYLYGNGNLTYNQSYIWAEYLHKYTQSTLLKRLAFGKCHYICVVECGAIQLIAPLVIKKGKATILGLKCAMDYFDFIYSHNVKREHFDRLCEYIRAKYRVGNISVPYLSSKSSTLSYFDDAVIAPHANISLDLQYDYFDDYFASLSKSTRQNIRTAANRATSDGVSIEYHHYKGKLDKTLAAGLINLHRARLNERYPSRKDGIYGTILYKFIRRIVCGKYVKDTQIYDVMRNGDESVRTSVIRMNGEIAGFYFGLSTIDGGVSLIRVCVNSKFARYSPGMLLGVEVVRENLHHMSYLDFTCGEEEYKYKLGAKNEEVWMVNIKL